MLAMTAVVVDFLWFCVLQSLVERMKVHAVRKKVHTEEQKKAIAAIERLGGAFWDDPYSGVDFRETDVRDAQLIYVGCLSSLYYLDLRGIPVTDQGLVHLSGLSDLEHLLLKNTLITDAGLKHLHTLRSLAWLDLEGTEVIAAALEELQQALPKLSIHLGPRSDFASGTLSEDDIFIEVSSEDPVNRIGSDAIGAEEYAVLSDLLGAMNLKKGEIVLIAGESMSAIDCFGGETSRFLFALYRSKSLPKLRRETLVAWERKNSRRDKWQDALFDPALPHLVCPTLEGSFFEPDKSWKHYDELWNRKSGPSVIVSRVGFDKSKTQAFVYNDYPYTGEYILAQKRWGKWRTVSSYTAFVR